MEAREPVELIEFLSPYPPSVVDLTLEARRFLLHQFWPVTEIYYDAMSAVCSGFTYTSEVRDNFVNLAVFAKHVTLIFPHGARLSDPEGRLKGDGSQVRHVRLESLATLQEPAIQDLLNQASSQAPRPLAAVEPTVLVKVMKGPKRRPVSAG